MTTFKRLYLQKNPKNNETKHKRHQNVDNITIADRLKTASRSNDRHPAGVVKQVYGIQPSNLPQKLCNEKDKHLQIC